MEFLKDQYWGLFFSLYVNDLPTIPKSANTESYVDDTKLFMSVNWNNLDNGLKELKWDLDSVAGWCCWNKCGQSLLYLVRDNY
jgi:hypothetical protein